MKAKLTLMACALLLMSTIAGAQEQKAPTAETPPSAKMTGQEAPSAGAQEEPSAKEIGKDIGEQIGERLDQIIGNVRHGIRGHGMMGRGMPMRMIFILMDTDGDGTLSLEEFQTAHSKIFKGIDADKDGKVTLEEMKIFFRGGSPTSDQ
jgi:EF hand